MTAIRIHPENRKLFEFRGKPLALLCATEHYGAVINRPFRYERYLADAAAKGQTLSRLFCLFRELQAPVNPYSTCKPESPDFIAPFPRTGPGRALDGEPRFDLEQWNPEYFERLHGFLSLASEYGVIVEVVLFSNTYGDHIWALNPLNPVNNITLDDSLSVKWQEYMCCRHQPILDWQRAHARKIVEETNQYDNIVYEICNEPGSFLPSEENLPDAGEVNAWQSQFIDLVRQTEAKLPQQHLIAGQEAFTYAPWEQPSDKTFGELGFDIVNMHPLPNTTFAGTGYDMGTFMSKQLKLGAVRDFALETYDQEKPLNYDEDNVATCYLDPDGWTIHRKRAWTTLFCGAHYDMIDFSILPRRETGTEESQRGIRTWMGHLSQFIHSVDLARARPLRDWLRATPDDTIESALAVEGEDYCIYLADGRELDQDGWGEEICGSVEMDLPDGEYRVSCYGPATGMYSPNVRVAGGRGTSLELPVFQHDLVVRIRRA